MLIPRRWPYVTSIIIALNVLLYIVTGNQLRQEVSQHTKIESRILTLAATHPQVPMTPAQQVLVDAFQHSYPSDWERMVSLVRNPADLAESARRAGEGDPVTAEMAELGRQLERFQSDSLTAHLAVYPPRHAPLSYLTANFLHRSSLHLLFNIWFLLLAGSILEDFWGRPIYGAFYLVSGAAGVWVYSLLYPKTLIPLVGATGAICALMGALVVRFPRTKIQRGTALWSVRPSQVRFSSPVYVVFPMWVLAEGLWGRLMDEGGSLPYWAQTGAFAFGAILALALRFTGMDTRVQEAIEAKEGWHADAHIVKAGEYVERGLLDSAIAELNLQTAEQPDSVEAYVMLKTLYQRKGDSVSCIATLEALCGLHLKFSYPEAAWQCYEDYCAIGGRRMPAATWLELCRFAEREQNWERALQEYEDLARTWPQERPSVVALMAAARIQLQQFGRADEAQRLYTQAQKSSVPHSEWEETIRKGLEKAVAAGKSNAAPVVSTSKLKT
jgi:membrane associated rhomboid family serine protease